MEDSLRQFLEAASIGGGRNFRPIAGFRGAEGRIVAPGRLYRSGFPGRFPEEALAAARRARIGTVVTLQTMRELEILGSVEELIPGTRWTHVPIGESWFDGSSPYPDGLEAMAEFYLSMVLDHRGSWARFLEIVARADHAPVLVHCTAGRDRTGVATLLVLEALGVDRGSIVDDYLASNHAFDGHAQTADVLAPLLAHIDEAGGIDAFARDLGVDAEVLPAMRRHLLVEESAAVA